MSLKGKLSEGAKKAAKAGVGLIAAGSFALGLPQEAKSQEFQENSIENTLEYDGSENKFRLGINYGLRSNNLPMGYAGLNSQAYHDANISAKYGIDRENSVGFMFGGQFTDEMSFSNSRLNYNYNFYDLKASYKKDFNDKEKLVSTLGYYFSEDEYNTVKDKPQDYIYAHPVHDNLSFSINYEKELTEGWKYDSKLGTFVDVSGKNQENSYYTDFSLNYKIGSNRILRHDIELGANGIYNGFYSDDNTSGSIYAQYSFENDVFGRRKEQGLYKWGASAKIQIPAAFSFGLNLRFTTD
ncbi:MAG: hypothetical protein ABEI74_00655 [Candidatus Pacearchaeota archaeon]